MDANRVHDQLRHLPIGQLVRTAKVDRPTIPLTRACGHGQTADQVLDPQWLQPSTAAKDGHYGKLPREARQRRGIWGAVSEEDGGLEGDPGQAAVADRLAHLPSGPHVASVAPPPRAKAVQKHDLLDPGTPGGPDQVTSALRIDPPIRTGKRLLVVGRDGGAVDQAFDTGQRWCQGRHLEKVGLNHGGSRHIAGWVADNSPDG